MIGHLHDARGPWSPTESEKVRAFEALRDERPLSFPWVRASESAREHPDQFAVKLSTAVGAARAVWSVGDDHADDPEGIGDRDAKADALDLLTYEFAGHNPEHSAGCGVHHGCSAVP